MQTLSSNAFSFDAQVIDAVSWLEEVAPRRYTKLLEEFPELKDIIWDSPGSWLDQDLMKIDPDWSGWVAQSLENTGLVLWNDGEPYGDEDGDFETLFEDFLKEITPDD